VSHWETPGASDEWYTPAYIFDGLGNPRFDLDVAAPMLIPAYIGARRWYWEGSLEKEWAGFIWMNPPFGGRNSLEPWLAKFFDHGNGIALTPDRTSAPWFRQAWNRADAVLFTPKVKFLRPDGSLGKSPSNGTALWAAGERGEMALREAAAKGLGILAIPVQQRRAA
jgi:hypothetical protein